MRKILFGVLAVFLSIGMVHADGDKPLRLSEVGKFENYKIVPSIIADVIAERSWSFGRGMFNETNFVECLTVEKSGLVSHLSVLQCCKKVGGTMDYCADLMLEIIDKHNAYARNVLSEQVAYMVENATPIGQKIYTSDRKFYAAQFEDMFGDVSIYYDHDNFDREEMLQTKPYGVFDGTNDKLVAVFDFIENGYSQAWYPFSAREYYFFEFYRGKSLTYSLKTKKSDWTLPEARMTYHDKDNGWFTAYNLALLSDDVDINYDQEAYKECVQIGVPYDSYYHMKTLTKCGIDEVVYYSTGANEGFLFLDHRKPTEEELRRVKDTYSYERAVKEYNDIVDDLAAIPEKDRVLGPACRQLRYKRRLIELIEDVCM